MTSSHTQAIRMRFGPAILHLVQRLSDSNGLEITFCRYVYTLLTKLFQRKSFVLLSTLSIDLQTAHSFDSKCKFTFRTTSIVTP